MTYCLFIDDERDPPNDGRNWTVVRSYVHAVAIMQAFGPPSYSSWDHDLGENSLDAMAIARWLSDHILDHDLKLSQFDFYVHSQNPIGRANLESYLGQIRSAFVTPDVSN